MAYFYEYKFIKNKYAETMSYFGAGCLFWGISVFIFYRLRPNTMLSKISLETMADKEKLITMTIACMVILCCVLPMALSPYWNGDIQEHRNQYEILTESILEGHIYLNYSDIDPKLLAMENPYDPALRKELGVNYHWDHAFYNGHYYMYFGVVPVFLLFLPFRLLTGVTLAAYHATQIFAALFIIGWFKLFFFLGKKFFPAMSWTVCLALTSAFSFMSLWYIAAAPALYCTAIASGLCMEVWSLFFFAKAVWSNSGERQNVLYGILGSFFGALAFGCRPPIALANLLAIPMFLHYLKGKRCDFKLCQQILLFLLPYAVIGLLLMIYNDLRFDNPFEFGQSYQLTSADQSNYGNVLSRFDLANIINGLLENFIAYKPLNNTFPYVSFSSVLINFPIGIAAFFCFTQAKTLDLLKKQHMNGFMIVLWLLPMLITIVEVLMSPYLLERYRSDIYWLIGLASFLSFGFFFQSSSKILVKKANFFVTLLCYITMLQCFLLWSIPHDRNFTACFPEYLEKFEAIFWLGLR